MLLDDSLSDLLFALRLRVGPPRLLRLRAPWCVTLPASWRGLHLVLAGRCALRSRPGPWRLMAGPGDSFLTCDGARRQLECLGEPFPPSVSLDQLSAEPFKPFRTAAPDETWLLSVQLLLESQTHPASRSLPGELLVRRQHIPAPLGLAGTLEAIQAELTRPTQGSQFAVTHLCETLVGHAFRVHQHELDGRERGWLRAFADPRLRPALARLQSIPSDPASALARTAVCSRTHFSRAFSTLAGATANTMIRQLRIHRAHQLLASGESSLARIAQQTGFGSVSALCRAFRRETGSTPAATWRTLHRRPLPRGQRLSDRGSGR